VSRILDRYAGALATGRMASRPDTTWSDSDVVGAAGLAAKRHELGIALARVLAGDDQGAHALVRLLSALAWGKARAEGAKLRRVQADDLARAVLAWFRSGRCLPCGGLGFQRAQGAPMLTDAACPACRGAGRIPFDRQFPLEQLAVARWLAGEIERTQGQAGAAAMAKLAPRLDLG
jgi:hypothetical protein